MGGALLFGPEGGSGPCGPPSLGRKCDYDGRIDMNGLTSLPAAGATDRAMRGFEFVAMIKTLARFQGDASAALPLAQKRAARRVVEALEERAVVGAGASQDIGSPTPWGTELSGAVTDLANGFIDSLRSESAFVRMAGDNAFIRMPLQTRFGIATSNATAGSSGRARPCR